MKDTEAPRKRAWADSERTSVGVWRIPFDVKALELC